MKKYLVIGNPIEHSLSPKLHNYWIKKNDINAVYDKKLVNESDIESDISAINGCFLNNKSTDELTFSEAFGYYRKCLGGNSQFTWKGIKYTTLLSNEINMQLVDSSKSEDIIEEDVSDKR